jgi:hypothetical protein
MTPSAIQAYKIVLRDMLTVVHTIAEIAPMDLEYIAKDIQALIERIDNDHQKD